MLNCPARKFILISNIKFYVNQLHPRCERWLHCSGIPHNENHFPFIRSWSASSSEETWIVGPVFDGLRRFENSAKMERTRCLIAGWNLARTLIEDVCQPSGGSGIWNEPDRNLLHQLSLPLEPSFLVVLVNPDDLLGGTCMLTFGHGADLGTQPRGWDLRLGVYIWLRLEDQTMGIDMEFSPKVVSRCFGEWPLSGVGPQGCWLAQVQG